MTTISLNTLKLAGNAFYNSKGFRSLSKRDEGYPIPAMSDILRGGGVFNCLSSDPKGYNGLHGWAPLALEKDEMQRELWACTPVALLLLSYHVGILCFQNNMLQRQIEVFALEFCKRRYKHFLLW